MLRYITRQRKRFSLLENRPYRPWGPSNILFNANRGWV